MKMFVFDGVPVTFDELKKIREEVIVVDGTAGATALLFNRPHTVDYFTDVFAAKVAEAQRVYDEQDRIPKMMEFRAKAPKPARNRHERRAMEKRRR